MWALHAAAALAEPLSAPELRQPENPPPVAAETAESPADVQSWIRLESMGALVDGEFDADRRALLRQGWQGRSPTWIQSTTPVNLGDFPTLDDSTERAERDLQTLEWVIEEQRRQATGKRAAGVADPDAAQADRWLRKVLPSHWIATLKENREWLAAGGTALLVIVWGTTTFARRPTSHREPPPQTQPQEAPRHRKRRRHHGVSHRAG